MIPSLLLSFALCASAVPLQTRKAPSIVPDFVTRYAPVVYLCSSDPYRPSDIGNQLTQTQPTVNFAQLNGTRQTWTLNNLNELNDMGGEDVYLTSRTDIEEEPSWMYGVEPESNGRTHGAVSSAIIVNDHGDGTVDAFYMYFYAFDYGGTYVGRTIGNHVGDWEHNMIRFKNGTPQAIWYSQHSFGQAFKYGAVEKYKGGLRPVVYSSNGSHANYATSGTHGRMIPGVNLPAGPINDFTDRGPIWDPTLSSYYYSFDATSQQFTPFDSRTPVNWLYFNGRWGDEQYPDSDPRQESIMGIDGLYKYSNGPSGPLDKKLSRKNVCPGSGICIVNSILVP